MYHPFFALNFAGKCIQGKFCPWVLNSCVFATLKPTNTSILRCWRKKMPQRSRVRPPQSNLLSRTNKLVLQFCFTFLKYFTILLTHTQIAGGTCFTDSDYVYGSYCDSKKHCVSVQYSKHHCYYNECGLGDAGAFTVLLWNFVDSIGSQSIWPILVWLSTLAMRRLRLTLRLQGLRCGIKMWFMVQTIAPSTISLTTHWTVVNVSLSKIPCWMICGLTVALVFEFRFTIWI